MEHRRRLPDVLGCVDDVDYHTVASTPYTAALARSSCVWAPSLSATHRGAQPAPCRRSSPGGVLPSAAASARHRRPPRPDRQPSPGCVDRGVLAGACGLTPAPAGAARVRVRSHSSAGLRPNRGSLWPQRRWPRLLHTASGRGSGAVGHGSPQHSRNRWFARPENLVVTTAIAEASPFPWNRTKTPRECPGCAGGANRPSAVIRPGWLLWLPRKQAGANAVPPYGAPKRERP